MALIPMVDPLRDLALLRRSMDQLFDDTLTRTEPSRLGFPVDLFETRDAIVVRAYLPGVKTDDVRVQLTAGQLVISAQRREASLPEDAVLVRMEMPTGEFVRSFDLNVPVDADDVAASFTDGVLEVRVAKAESVRPRMIPVTTAQAALGDTRGRAAKAQA